jgi:hypothetical protein
MKRFVVAVLSSLAFQAFPSQAETQLGVGLEYFDWSETTTPQVKETGPLLSLHASYVEDKTEGIVFGAKGRLWLGSVDYEGATLITNQPISGTTDYSGIAGEGQIRWRSPAGANHLDVLFGLGFDYWVRKLTRDQSEEYTVLAARLAVESSPNKESGLLAGVGVKYPFYVSENGNFKDVGATNNPTLKPKGALSATAHLGFRIDRRWQIIGYYESIWLDESDPVFVNFPSGASLSSGFYFQPESRMNVIGIRVEYRIQ